MTILKAERLKSRDKILVGAKHLLAFVLVCVRVERRAGPEVRRVR